MGVARLVRGGACRDLLDSPRLRELQGVPLVIRTFTVTFNHVLEISGGVAIECEVAAWGRTPFTLAERAQQNGQACATGEVV